MEVYAHIQLAIRLLTVSLKIVINLFYSVLLPYAVKRAGIVSFLVIMTVLTLLSYFTSVLVYESTRLLLGNYKMRQKTDFESLLSSHSTNKSLAVVISKHIYLIQLVLVASIGIILSTYTTDNLFENVFGRTYGIQLIPEPQILSDKNSGT